MNELDFARVDALLLLLLLQFFSLLSSWTKGEREKVAVNVSANWYDDPI